MKKNLLFVLLTVMGLSLVMFSCQKAPELTISGPTNIELSADGSSASITFTANRDWKVTSSDSWVSVSPSSGTAADGAVSVTVRCDANTTYEDRTATVTIKMEDLSQTITVKQPANLGIILPTQSFDLQSDAKTIEVTVQANVEYTVSTSADWIKQTGTKTLTSKTLTFSLAENKTYDSREGKITIKPQQGNVQEQVITVRQAQKDALIVEKTSYDMPYGGGEIEIKVEVNVAFDVTPNVDWLHYTQTKALSTSTVCIKVDENTTYSNREGKIDITQKNGTLKHTITVKQAGRIAVTSVELNKTSLKMKEGDSETLVATVKPDNATDKTVIWTSSNPEVATVDETGKVSAVKVGPVTITAKAEEKTAECKVTVLVPVSSIVLNKTELNLFVGESETLVATVKPDDATEKTVTWSSSNAEVATVDANGKVTAKKEGSATITAKAGDKTAECKVSVGIAVTSIELNKTNITLNVGDSETLVATVKPDIATDKTVTWTSSDSEVATVDETGKVTAVKAGNATITASAGSKTAECDITAIVPVSSIELNKTTLPLIVGDSETLVATIKPDDATDKSVTWSSSDVNVAQVDNSGKVTAIKVGNATITAKAGEKSASCSVTVQSTSIKVTSITLNKSSLTLSVGSSETLIATLYPSNATETVHWGSSNPDVASVDSNGKVTGLKNGSATITALAGEKTATCTVSVVSNTIAVTSITLDQTSLSLKVGESVSLKATVKPDNATDKTVTWSSSNTSVVKVDSNGKVTAISAGSANIMAVAGEKKATCSVLVSSVQVPSGAVDLGIVITREDGSTYLLFWAKCNIGASKPEEYGDYFSWGEIEPKTDYSMSAYKWWNPSSRTLTKYNTYAPFGIVDNKTVLDPEDDVAHIKLGDKWRMPTKDEWAEFYSNCTLTWTSQNGVNGCLATSKINGNSVFLPASGYWKDSSLTGSGSTCAYWTSSLKVGGDTGSWSIAIFSGGNGWSYGSRAYGLSVRPVSE